MGQLRNDLTGQRFSRILVLERAKNKGRRVTYLCRCDCGKEFVTLGQNLTSGGTKSCGCLNREKAAQRMKKIATTHGRSKSSPLYSVWKGMRKRCNNPHYHHYFCYGGKGIKVCADWDSFENFEAWAIAHDYKKGLSLDRIDGNKGYSPENCRWTDSVTQNNNSSQNHIIEFCGESKTVAEWCKKLNMPQKL